MRTRTAILFVIFVLTAIGLLTVACIITIPDGPAPQTPVRPLDIPGWPEGTPEMPSRGVGVLEATPTIFCTIPTSKPSFSINVSLPGEYYLPLYDTFICKTEPDANFGNNSTASLNRDCSLLLEWPTLAGSFQGRTVTQAKLRLFVIGQPTPEKGSSVFFVNPTVPNWNELAATWNRRTLGTNWATAGARGAGFDYSNPPQGYMSVNGSSAGWVDIDINGSLINSWVNNPASNQGLIIWSSTARNDLRIATSEWFSFGYRPQLVLSFQ